MSDLARTCGVYPVMPEHAEAIQTLVSDPLIAATAARIPHPYPPNGARDFIARQLEERKADTAHVFVILDRKEVRGLVGVHGLDTKTPELGYWVGRPYWGKGYATFGAGIVLQFGFNNLRLDRITSQALETNVASRRVLEKCGFQLTGYTGHDVAKWKPTERLAVYELTKQGWQDFRNGPALKSLHPALKKILEAELAAGNEVAETGHGWPDKDSVFVRLKHPFRAKPSPLPEGVDFNELNDPHWWKADYCTRSPRHVLAC